MALASIVVLASFLIAAPVSQSKEPPAAGVTGEIRVLVTDAEGKPPDLSEATVLVYLEPAGGRRETRKPELKPAGAAASPEGVQWREAKKWRIGVQFATGGAAPSVPHFAAPFAATSYACHMKDAPPSETPGKCPKCGMEMELGPTELDAVVVLRIGGETVNVRGFHYPPETPPSSFAEGVAKIEAAFADLDRLVSAGKHDAAHGIADKLTRLAAATVATADAPKGASLAAAAKSFGDLANELDDAHHYGTPDDVKAVMALYRKAAAAMRGPAPGE